LPAWSLCSTGGAFLLPLQGFAAAFWKHIQSELQKQNTDVGVAILNYSKCLLSTLTYNQLILIAALVPSATFPTQLSQAIVAIEHLISTGVQPQNIQIVGDSAGANLILQVISHMLHPLEGVRPLKLSSPIRGVYLVSPWIALNGTEGSMTLNDDSDAISLKSFNDWGSQILKGVPESQLPYLEAIRAPTSWFKSMDTVVERVLITAGSAECLRDPIEEFAKRIASVHDGTTFLMQKYGVHHEPYFELTNKKKFEKLTPQIVEWLATGFNAA
jgi:acetyl esterase/lipase